MLEFGYGLYGVDIACFGRWARRRGDYFRLYVYRYASVTCHVGAKVVMVDTAPDSFEMDYDKLADAITEKTKVVLPVDLAGVVCDYDKIFAAVESKKHLFSPVNDIQKAYGRVIVLADAAHAFGAKCMERCVVRSLILLRFPSMP